MNTSIAFILQARTGSTRLPKKVVLPFFNKMNILDIILLKLERLDFPIILATSNSKNDEALLEFKSKYNIEVFRGDEENVLSRFQIINKTYNFRFNIRVCADNPFLSIVLLKKLLLEARCLEYDFDYLSFTYKGKPTILTHFGFFVEIVKTEALDKISQYTSETLYREHVTNFLYTNPDKFKIKFVELGDNAFWDENIRLTVDTLEDFQAARKIFGALFQQYGWDFDIKEIDNYLEKHPSLIERMKVQIRKNSK